MKKLLNALFKMIGFKLLRFDKYLDLIKKSKMGEKGNFLITYLESSKTENCSEIFQNINDSKSQLSQDIFVLDYLNFKKNGFFVEFGAANGLDLSNTYMLEKQYNWTGIIAEPGIVWHESIAIHRNCNFSKLCVWESTGDELDFDETSIPELSTFSKYVSHDNHKRKSSNRYKVKTISLNDLLSKYDAPKTIDYISIDTEGSEFQILKKFDFDKYEVKIFTIEHNYTKHRAKIFQLMTAKGYIRVYENLSRFDDWYIKKVD